jgi:hypothetical protein
MSLIKTHTVLLCALQVETGMRVSLRTTMTASEMVAYNDSCLGAGGNEVGLVVSAIPTRPGSDASVQVRNVRCVRHVCHYKRHDSCTAVQVRNVRTGENSQYPVRFLKKASAPPQRPRCCFCSKMAANACENRACGSCCLQQGSYPCARHCC